MSLSVLLAQNHIVTVLDINSERVSLINNKKSTILDKDIESWLDDKVLTISATMDSNKAYLDADFVIIATPTDYDAEFGSFDTKSVDSVVGEVIASNPHALIVIKSTIPVGHTASLQKKFKTNRIIFSPEFLREGMALFDNLYPSRIIIGGDSLLSHEFGDLLAEGALKHDIDKLFIPSTEAEAIKLFSNTYLAMRVSFFNELDTYAIAKNLDTKSIIDGLSLDPRIGKGYNNPSFGYGGYCLPKDTKQLLSNYGQVPQSLIQAIVSSNKIRKDFLTKEIIKKKPKVIGIFGLAMKKGSDNYRFSAIQDMIQKLKIIGKEIIIFEPQLEGDNFNGCAVCNDLESFKAQSEIILTNRIAKELKDVKFKVFTRDIYKEN